MKFDVCIMDPPYTYENKKTGGSMKSGSAQKYQTMTLDEIKSIPIHKIMKKDSILFLWATVPLLPEALEIMKHYKYKYKTSIFWNKKNINGIGYYYRGQVEILLMGIKGHIKAFKYQKPNIINAKRSIHSTKPTVFKTLISKSVCKSIPNASFVELFARKQYKKWICTGYDIDGLDIYKAIDKLNEL